MATLDGIGRWATGQHPALKWAYLIMAMALMIEMFVVAVGIGLGISSGDHFANSLAVRNAAASGGPDPGILSQIGTITAVKGWLVPLQFVGIAMFFAGITAVLAVIVKVLQTRGQAMELAFPQILGTGGGASAESSAEAAPSDESSSEEEA